MMHAARGSEDEFVEPSLAADLTRNQLVERNPVAFTRAQLEVLAGQ